MRAYLIEPQKLFVPYLTAVLRSGGIEVVATCDDVDGHDIVAHAPDAIFVDIDFFNRGGPSTLCRIREVARRATIVAMSDSNDPTFEASCYISGANAMVQKSSAAENARQSRACSRTLAAGMAVRRGTTGGRPASNRGR